MKKTRWMLTCLVLATVLLQGCSDEENDAIVKSWAERLVPREAKILEYVPTVGQSSRTAAKKYVIYKFRGQCILMYYGADRLAHTTINCPKDSR